MSGAAQQHGRDESTRRPIIGIAMGDPSGVGAELIVRALEDVELRRRGRFIVFGLHEAVTYAADRAEIAPYWFRKPHESVHHIQTGVVVADFDEFGVFPGPLRQPSRTGGEASIRFLEEAVARAKSGLLDAIVTAPVSMRSWQHARVRHKTLPAYLADAFHLKRYTQALLGGPLRVALASDQEPLFGLWHRFAIGLIFHPIDRLHTALAECFNIERPRIGVCSLNPPGVHTGRFGDEEDRVIEPAIVMAREAGMLVEGPLPASELFSQGGNGFDGVVALYYDQGAVAVRLMAPRSALSATLGLPVVHVAPLTGPSFELAGFDRADARPMSHAISTAIEMVENRRCVVRGNGRQRRAKVSG